MKPSNAYFPGAGHPEAPVGVHIYTFTLKLPDSSLTALQSVQTAAFDKRTGKQPAGLR